MVFVPPAGQRGLVSSALLSIMEDAMRRWQSVILKHVLTRALISQLSARAT